MAIAVLEVMAWISYGEIEAMWANQRSQGMVTGVCCIKNWSQA